MNEFSEVHGRLPESCGPLTGTGVVPAADHLPKPASPMLGSSLYRCYPGTSCWPRGANFTLHHGSLQPSLRRLPFPALRPATGSCQTGPHGLLLFLHLRFRRASPARSPSLLGTPL